MTSPIQIKIGVLLMVSAFIGAAIFFISDATASSSLNSTKHSLIEKGQINVPQKINSVSGKFVNIGAKVRDLVTVNALPAFTERVSSAPDFVTEKINFLDQAIDQTLYQIASNEDVQNFSDFMSGNAQPEDKASDSEYIFDLEERALETDGVLVPNEKVVLSSSHDGRIKEIYVHNGDRFKKGDILLEYVCAEIWGNQKIVAAETTVVQEKIKSSFRLLNLGLLSDIDKIQMDAEQVKAQVQADVLKEEIKKCRVTAPFSGRVTNRLANPNEFTRTDRVLLEIANTQNMQVQFVVPARWLRWINIGAPLSVSIEDVDKTYSASIVRIHGEVDPVSETIQIVAQIDSGKDSLYPGMSSLITIDAKDIRENNIRGILEEQIQW